MHIKNKLRIPKIITSLLAVFALIFGLSAFGVTAAQAVTNGCISSGFQPQNCYSQRTPISDIVAVINSSASTTATVSGSCTAPVTFTLTAASTPNTPLTTVAGLTFTTTATTATLGGTTQGTAFATTGYVILATCSSTVEAFTFSVTVTAAATPIILPATQTIDATTNTAITNSVAYTASNFSGAPIVYSVLPTLPSGLSLNSGTGVISGTPTLAQTATSYTVTATYTTQTATATVTITVTNPPAPSVTPGTVNITGTAGSAITNSSTLTAANFSGTVAYTIAPALPAGLTLNSSTGVISGTPSAVQGATNYTITATYLTQTATTSVTITVNPAAPVYEPPSRKVTICHRTHATTNPYVRITVDYNSVNKKSGHQGHDEIFAGEHVFKAGIYKRAKDKDWGDIIPADPSGLNRWQPLNWTTLGAQIYNGTVDGCPSYDPVKYYNALREAGVPEKKIKQEIADLETEQAEANPSAPKTNTTNLKYTGTNSSVAEAENDKVTLCHRTNSTTNPYVKITVAASSVLSNRGHYGHDEIYEGHHVFDSTVNYPSNKKDWGDIIPADPSGKNRWQPLNWTTLGQAIYNGTVAGCTEKTTQEIYNELRESGKSRNEVIKELENQKNVDDDPKDIDESTYTGNDPEVEKSEPKEPTDPNPNVVNQSLSGIVWLDLNRDGLKDPNEPFMPNITLSVVQVTSVTPTNLSRNTRIMNVRVNGLIRPAAVTTIQTDANGYYLFASLGAGDWQVVTGIPQDLSVTYDSQAHPDGEIIATVPVASHAFTWVGLVGQDDVISEKLLEEILTKNPEALPLAELPPTLQKKVAAIIAKQKAAEEGKQLAATGTDDLEILNLGLFLILSGLVLAFSHKRKPNN